MRTRRALGLPEPRHHELQERRLDPPARDVFVDAAATALSQLDLPCSHLIEHGLDERRLDLDGPVRGQLVVAVDRSDDRLARRVPVEMVEPEVVAEHVGNAGLEPVELRERVLADREQEARPQARPGDGLGEVLEEAVRLVTGAVVEEVLLEPVEDDEDLGVRERGAALERLRERVRGLLARRVRELRSQGRRRVVLPVVEDDHLQPLGQRAQVADDAGAQHGALPNAGLAVQHRERRGHQVGGDDFPLALPTEEEERVELGVLEGGQTLVGA